MIALCNSSCAAVSRRACYVIGNAVPQAVSDTNMSPQAVPDTNMLLTAAFQPQTQSAQVQVRATTDS